MRSKSWLSLLALVSISASANVPLNAATPARAAAEDSALYMIFFAGKEAELTPQAIAILDNAVEMAKSLPDAPIKLDGHVDDTMSEQEAMERSKARVTAVGQYLISHGIAAARVQGQGFGATRQLVVQKPGVPEPQNNRVEILVGKSSDW